MKIIFFLSVLCAFAAISNAQNSYSIFYYKIETGFDTIQMPTHLIHRMEKEDGAFCDITLYKSEANKDEEFKNVISQWNANVVKILDRASKKPLKIYSGKSISGWKLKIAEGVFYTGKKKCSIQLLSFSKDKKTALITYAYSDKLFKWITDEFTKNLKIPNKD